MNCDVTITADEFKTIHNGLYELDSIVRKLENTIHPDLYKKLSQTATDIRNGLTGAYEQEHKDFVNKSRHYDDFKKQMELANSEWSIYSVEDLGHRHPFKGADRVVYNTHWGDKPVAVSVDGKTWSALWRAADAAIRDSGDNHHVYIEAFERDAEDPRTLVLVTGS